MVCTEERNMTMANGKKFSTGNHPVEMALPMLHLLNARLEIDYVAGYRSRKISRIDFTISESSQLFYSDPILINHVAVRKKCVLALGQNNKIV